VHVHVPSLNQVVQVDLARRSSELVALVEDRQKVLHSLDLAIAKLQCAADKLPMVRERKGKITVLGVQGVFSCVMVTRGNKARGSKQSRGEEWYFG